MNKTFLITGGSGLIGTELSQLLLQKGYTIHHLSRSGIGKIKGVKTFLWDIEAKEIDAECIKGVGCIIHLAGENIGGKPWTKKQKKLIVESRTESIHLIYDLLKKTPEHSIKKVISASAVGYYGNRGDELLSEDSGPGADFLARTCIRWENAVDQAKDLNIRVVKLRTGVVLSLKGGALKEIEKPVRLGIGAALGTGKQWMPWIHLDDLLNIYCFLAKNIELEGVFNASAPFPVTNSAFTKEIARQLKKNLWLPAVPSFALRILLGEMCVLILNSTKTSSEKICRAGFTFKFENLDKALKDIYARQ